MVMIDKIVSDIRVSTSREVAITAVNNYPQIHQQYNISDAIERITNFWAAQMQIFQHIGTRPPKLRVLNVCQTLGVDRSITRQFARLCGYRYQTASLANLDSPVIVLHSFQEF